MKKLILYKPQLEELWFRQTLMSDAETMSYNHKWGGTISFPKERWNDWYNRWIINHDKQRFYRYLKNENGEFVGEIAYYFDEDYNTHVASVIIFSKYRRRGYGRNALELLVDSARKNGLKEISDDIATDNPAINMFLDYGFKEQFRNEDIIMLKKEI